MRLNLALMTTLFLMVQNAWAAENLYSDTFVASKATNAKHLVPEDAPKIFSGKDKVKDKQRMEELGFELIGYSDFQAGDVSPEMAVLQAKAVQADRVLVYSERASNVPASVKIQQMRDAKNGKQTNTGSDVIYRYFATYWAKLAKPSLGVHVKVPQKDEVSQGLQVLVVMEDSPAKTIGLMKGDVLLSIGELQLSNVTDLSKALNQYAGQTVDIVYTRDNMRFDEKISLN
jgi:hypothetical protein